MYSAVQALFMYDVNCVRRINSSNEANVRNYVNKLKLCTLKFLVEFNSLVKENDFIQWAFKFYDSQIFKPDTSHKKFCDFNKKSFQLFEEELFNKYREAVLNSNKELHSKKDNNISQKYILNKALQEVVIDYNWDKPEFCSPVKHYKKKKTRNCKSVSTNVRFIPDDKGLINIIFIFTHLPSNEEIAEFCGISNSDDSFQNNKDLFCIFDCATVSRLEDSKNMHLHFIDTMKKHGTPMFLDKNIYSAFFLEEKLNSNVELLDNIVENKCQNFNLNYNREFLEESNFQPIFCSPNKLLRKPILPTLTQTIIKKGASLNSQKNTDGPVVIWEDAEGIFSLSFQLEVLLLNGSSPECWKTAYVCGISEGTSANVATVAGQAGSLFMCQSSSLNFNILMNILDMHQLTLLSCCSNVLMKGLALICFSFSVKVLQFEMNSFGLLSSCLDGLGCLAILSNTGLATLPLLNNDNSSLSMEFDDKYIIGFIAKAVEKCLKLAPQHNVEVSVPTKKHFMPHFIEKWFCPAKLNMDLLRSHLKKKQPMHEQDILSKLQKKYSPQLPLLFSNIENTSCEPIETSHPEKNVSNPSQKNSFSNDNSSKPPMTRAQQLVKKSKIVSAQQKVKEQLAEEEEIAQATEKRVAQASERAKKSQALADYTLSHILNPRDEGELVKSLIFLRDDLSADLFTSAQTIINLSLMHIREGNSVSLETELLRILNNGILCSSINLDNKARNLRECKLQVLLNLELLWVLGYSSSPVIDENSKGVNMREQHLDEIVKMLRAISLHHSTAEMVAFLQDIILENYADILGEVLINIYEELNQPLPQCLIALAKDENLFSLLTSPSEKSQTDSVKSVHENGDIGSTENPGSDRSQEGARKLLVPRRSLRELNKRQIVVPAVSRVITRSSSLDCSRESCKKRKVSCSDTKENVKKVRRSLFISENNKHATPLKRRHTVSSIRDNLKSPEKINLVKHKLFSSPKLEFRTPTKSNMAGVAKTPNSNRKKILVPETPNEKNTPTKLLRRETDCSIIVESPDLKCTCKSTPNRLHASLSLKRRSSFYSGATSRNCERAKTRLLADKIQGTVKRSLIDSHGLSNSNGLEAKFLFSEFVT